MNTNFALRQFYPANFNDIDSKVLLIISNGFILLISATDPPVEGEGSLYYNSVDQTLRVSNGPNSWVVVNAALDAALQSIANLNTVGGEMLYTVGVNTYALTGITLQGRQLVAAVNQNTGQAVLGLVIGTDVQAQSTALSNFSGVSSGAANNQLIYSTGPNTFTITNLTAFARSFLDDLTAADARAT